MNAHERNPGLLEDRRPSDDRLPTITAPGYETTTTLIAPGETLLIVDDRWVGALIFVTVGSIQLECHDGATYTFPAGSILGFSDRATRRPQQRGLTRHDRGHETRHLAQNNKPSPRPASVACRNRTWQRGYPTITSR